MKALIQTVEDVAPYLQSALDYTSLQAEKGLLMLSPEDVAQECRKTVSMGMDSSVLAEMERKLDALGLGEKGEGYKAQLEEAFSSSYLAAMSRWPPLGSSWTKAAAIPGACAGWKTAGKATS